jgi:t-SNARE complex subunit (syntaxin)
VQERQQSLKKMEQTLADLAQLFVDVGPFRIPSYHHIDDLDFKDGNTCGTTGRYY